MKNHLISLISPSINQNKEKNASNLVNNKENCISHEHIQYENSDSYSMKDIEVTNWLSRISNVFLRSNVTATYQDYTGSK